jgi:hypothetical protein
VFEGTPLYQPVPVHVEKGASTPWTAGDFLLAFEEEFCYKQGDWVAANLRDAYNIKITEDENLVASIRALSEAVQENLTFYDISDYTDNAISLTFLGRRPLPIFTENPQTARNLNTIMVLEGYMRLFSTEQQLRPISTPIFN